MGTQEEVIEKLKNEWTPTEEIILKRRSVRLYKKEQVPEFMIHRILQAGRFSPSAGNGQPWKFVVIRDPEIINGITDTTVKLCKIAKCLNDYRVPGKRWRLPIAKLNIRMKPRDLHPVPFGGAMLIADGKLGLFHGAPTVILIFKDIRGISQPELDCGIAGQNMALTAHSMALGTCWVSFVKLAFQYSGKWNKKLAIKYPYKFVTSLAIGWPVGEPDGIVARPTHEVDWYENGAKKVVHPVGKDQNLTFFEKRRVPLYDDPNQTVMGVVEFDEKKCKGCGLCAKICPANTLEMVGKKARMKQQPECMACSDCVAICPEGAILATRNFRYTGRFKTIGVGELQKPCL